jgi:hypothetical protein
MIRGNNEQGGKRSREDTPGDKYNRVLWMNKDISYALALRGNQQNVTYLHIN